MTAPLADAAKQKVGAVKSLTWSTETAAGLIALGALGFLVLVAVKFPVVSAA